MPRRRADHRTRPTTPTRRLPRAIVSLYFLYLLHSEKGKRVMTTEYQQIVEQTPHIQYRTSWIAWLVLALFIAAFIAMIVLAAGV